MTAQICDQIIWQGKRYSLYCEPFLQYQLQHKDKARQFAFLHTTTANWRGYRARWEIKEDFLWLNAISGWVWQEQGKPKYYRLPQVMGTREPVKATWFSGTLILPFGPLLRYVHMPYASQYAGEIRIKVVKGKIEQVNDKRLDTAMKQKCLSSTHQKQ